MPRAPSSIRALRHWLVDLAFGAAVEGLKRLPARSEGLARLLGAGLQAGAGSVTPLIRANLRLALGATFSAQEREELRRRHFRHLAAVALEILEVVQHGWDRIEKTAIFEGEEILQTALRAGKGAVCLSGHVGNWELLPGLLGRRGYRACVVTRRMKNERLDRRLLRLRSALGVESIDREAPARVFLRHLRDSNPLGLLADIDARVEGIVVPFFGFPAYTPMAAASLARAAGCPLIPVFHHRLADGSHRIQFHEPVFVARKARGAEAARPVLLRYHRLLEEAILQHPEQWLWGQKRWLKQAPGESEGHWQRRLRRAGSHSAG